MFVLMSEFASFAIGGFVPSAAIAGIFSESSGIINLALEGIILFGAFSAAIASFYLENPWLVLLFAIFFKYELTSSLN